MSRHTLDELKQWQALPLSIKVRMTETRIMGWVDEYGEDGVYVAFSGGKDSTVLLDIARKLYPNIKAMFVDVPTQYIELREFAQTFDNVDIVKPKISFMQVCEKYGFPLISKEVSECVQGARKYLKSIEEDINKDKPYEQFYRKVCGIGEYSKHRNEKEEKNLEELAKYMNEQLGKGKGEVVRTAQLLGMWTNDKKIKVKITEKDRSQFSQERWKFLLESKFEISNRCCNIMKKEPSHNYAKKTGRCQITAQMACESRLRTQKWLENGCNGFHLKIPTSNPMAFWTENDVLEYIYKHNLPICSVYGKVVEDYDAEGIIDGQITLLGNENKIYKTTGCKRTGCMLCGFGCHLEKSPNRFEQLKETHPKMYGLLDVCKNNGVTYREAIEWVNEHGNLDIKL